MKWMVKQFKADMDTLVKDAERRQMITIAHSHFLRAEMDGERIKKTGEVIPRETGTAGRKWW